MPYIRKVLTSFIVSTSLLTDHSMPNDKALDFICGDLVVRPKSVLGSGGTGTVYSAQNIGVSQSSIVLKVGKVGTADRLRNECKLV